MLGDLTTCLVLSVVGEAAVTSREQTHLANDNHLVHQQAHQMHQQVHLVHQQVHLVDQQVEEDALSARYKSDRCISKAMSTDHKLN